MVMKLARSWPFTYKKLHDETLTCILVLREKPKTHATCSNDGSRPTCGTRNVTLFQCLTHNGTLKILDFLRRTMQNEVIWIFQIQFHNQGLIFITTFVSIYSFC